MEKTYAVYILASRSRVLYAGVTGNLMSRLAQHRSGNVPGFTGHYRVHRLVYFEAFADIREAIAREKEIKGWRRPKKIALIEAQNRTWEDLSERYFSRDSVKDNARKKQIPPRNPPAADSSSKRRSIENSTRGSG